jgi:hypothetical protein
VQLVGRLRADRRWHQRPPTKHGPEFRLDSPLTWPPAQHTTITETSRYGTARAEAWDRLHPRLTRRTCWLDHHGDLPVIEGTLIRLQVDHLPGDRDPKPLWLWSSRTGATATDIDRWWQAFLRRFDLEHTFRLFKQTLGWTRPKIRDPQAADRAAHRRAHPATPCPHPRPRSTPPLGNDPLHPAASPPPASAEGFETSAQPPPSPPVHRNPPQPDQDGQPDHATEQPHPTTRSGRPSNAT